MKFILLALVLSGCTRGQLKQFTALGTKGSVICYSGGKVIYEGQSTGKIHTERESDGWFFEDLKTNKLVRVSGDCVIQH